MPALKPYHLHWEIIWCSSVVVVVVLDGGGACWLCGWCNKNNEIGRGSQGASITITHLAESVHCIAIYCAYACIIKYLFVLPLPYLLWPQSVCVKWSVIRARELRRIAVTPTRDDFYRPMIWAVVVVFFFVWPAEAWRGHIFAKCTPVNLSQPDQIHMRGCERARERISMAPIPFGCPSMQTATVHCWLQQQRISIQLPYLLGSIICLLPFSFGQHDLSDVCSFFFFCCLLLYTFVLSCPFHFAQHNFRPYVRVSWACANASERAHKHSIRLYMPVCQVTTCADHMNIISIISHGIHFVVQLFISLSFSLYFSGSLLIVVDTAMAV